MKLKVMFKIGAARALLLSFSIALTGCGGDPGGAVSIPADPLAVAESTRETYAEIALASYEDSLDAARDLDAAIVTFVEEPSDETLRDARQAWLAAREPYLQTEVYRFYDGPIDNPEDGPEGLLNAWPLEEKYIDYVEGEPEAGIINDPEQEISIESLVAANELDGEKNIATGYHAIEFLLWGQDRSDDGPGDRPYTDYVTDGSGTAENQDRRAEYLLTVSELLLDNLTGLVEAWDTGSSSNYRAEFVNADAEDALTRMLTGMILLAGNETGGERLQAALVTGDQEDEHSCFSDNTKRDMVQDVQGIVNVWYGTYTRIDGSPIVGYGVRDVIHAQNKALESETSDKLDECLDLANALQDPFDREIATDNPDGNERVEALILALQDLSELFVKAFTEFGLDVPEPP
jgi:putative iron-regulated protein